ncbi:MAG: DNA repair protein RecN [Crocinitomicaceae bacterium]
MLKKLEIANYALIENVSLDFKTGFTSMTGETGAGKSILLKALSLLMGERADTSVIKGSEKKCILEAVFDIDALQLEAFFETNDLDYDRNCIMRREITTSGKSRAFINDTPVSIAALKSLGEQLIAIHTQHQTLEVLGSGFQIDLLDHFVGITAEVAAYNKKYNAYLTAKDRYTQLQIKEKENRKEKDYLAYLIHELVALKLDQVDLENLESTASKIENAEKINNTLSFARSVFENDSFSPAIGIKTLIESFDELKQYDENYAAIAARLLSLKIELDDIEAEVNNLETELDIDPEEALLIQEKIEAINALLFKHNLKELSELRDLQEKLTADLDAISNVENDLSKYEAMVKSLSAELKTAGLAIRTKRQKFAPQLAEKAGSVLDQLSMKNAELKIELQALDVPGPKGMDKINFLFKTNAGGDFASLKKTASGGELSRLMLALLSILSEKKNLPTLIFDEIDTGVSGEVAGKMASLFDQMGKQIQVLSITHLPQVAAKGAQQLHVYKESATDKTITRAEELTPDERITVLAGMMSAGEITELAKENAANLLSTI